MIIVNPECEAGKHGNCTGKGFDDESDDFYVDCPCSCHTSDNYIASELHNIDPAGVGRPYLRVKFSSALGDTKWLNITAEQFDQIRKVLTLGSIGSTDSR